MNSIAPGLGKSLPNLRTLVLSQNFIAELADLNVLSECKKLTHVCLVDNAVASKEVCILSVHGKKFGAIG